MSFSRALATGRGKLEFRLAIEGLPYEFVTSAAMERDPTASSGTAGRYNGLQHDGLVIDENVDIPGAKLRVADMSLRIADIKGKATAAFGQFPTKTTWINEDVDGSETSITVTSTSGWSQYDVLHVGTEAMLITAIPDSTTFTVTRASYSTIAQYHYTENGANYRLPEGTNCVPSLEGRRAYIYAYGEGDITAGSPTNGTQIYVGIISGEPRLNQNLAEWQITLSSVAKLLDQDVGYSNIEPLSIRGIYHPWNAPFLLYVSELNSANIHASSDIAANGTDFPIRMINFWESQQDFVDDLRTELQAEDGTFTQGGTLDCVAVDDNTIKILYTAGPVTARYCVLYQFQSWGLYDQDGGGFVASGGWYDESEVKQTTLVAGRTYHCYLRTSTPRSSAFMVNFTPFNSEHYDASQATNYPETRAYLSGSIPLSIALATTVAVSASGDKYVWPQMWTPTTDDPNYRSIDFDPSTMTVVKANTNPALREYANMPSGRIYTTTPSGTLDEQVTFSFNFYTATAITAGDVAGYLDNIVDYSNRYCNVGLMPFLTTTDYDQVLSEQKLDPAIDNRPWATNRTYYFGKAKKLGVVLAEELKLIGCYPCLGSTGKIRFRKLEMPSGSSPTAFSITNTNSTWSSMPMWERNSLGMLNTVEYQGGYSASDEKWTSAPVVVRDVTGFGQTKIAKSISVKPFSYSKTEPGYNDVTTIASEYFGAFGYPYVLVTIAVPFTLFQTALVGTMGSFTSDVLPDETDGTRGYTSSKVGLVIGRRWDLKTGQGTLTMYVPIARVAGYTPAVRITARTNTSGNIWQLTVSDAQWDALSSTYYGDSGALSTYFPVGTRVLVYQWDNSSPTTLAGTVTTVDSTTQLTVTFDSTWTPGTISTTNAWNLGYDVASSSGLATAQSGYAYIAGTDLRIDFATSQAAKVFGA